MRADVGARAGRVAAGLVLALALAQSARPDCSDPGRQPSGRVYQALVRSPTTGASSDLPASAFHDPPALPGPPGAVTGIALVDSAFENYASSHPDERDTFLVVMRDTVAIPAFPLTSTRPGGFDRTDSLVARLRHNRAPLFDALAARMGRDSVQVVERFWLYQALRVVFPLRSFPDMKSDSNVVELLRDRPLFGASSGSCIEGSVSLGSIARQLRTKEFRDAALQPVRLGLLDTGIHRNHRELAATKSIYANGDCTISGTCPEPADDLDMLRHGHGTRTASVLIGAGACCPDTRGLLTDFEAGAGVDGLQVYTPATAPDCNGDSSGLLAQPGDLLAAAQQALVHGDDVVVAELQNICDTPDNRVVEQLENNVATGQVVLAAVGNDTPDPGQSLVPPGLPGSIGCVLAVGGYTASDVPIPEQGGVTKWGWTKPDVLAPTNECAAAPDGKDETRVEPFNSTSGATACASAAAALACSWLRTACRDAVDAGQVMALLELCGSAPIQSGQTMSAVPMSLPDAGRLWFGKVCLERGKAVDVPVTFARSGRHTVDAAIWWPERVAPSAGPFTHHAFTLTLSWGSGSSGSDDPASVVQHVRSTFHSPDCTLTLRHLSGDDAPRTAYWCAWVR